MGPRLFSRLWYEHTLENWSAEELTPNWEHATIVSLSIEIVRFECKSLCLYIPSTRTDYIGDIANFISMSDKPKIRVGTDSFAKLLLESNVFVDKSMFIQEFLEESSGDVVLITHPRRWGKSLSMDMLGCSREIAVDLLK